MVRVDYAGLALDLHGFKVFSQSLGQPGRGRAQMSSGNQVGYFMKACAEVLRRVFRVVLHNCLILAHAVEAPDLSVHP